MGRVFAVVAAAAIELLEAETRVGCSPDDATLPRIELHWRIEAAEVEPLPLLLEVSILRHDWTPGQHRYAIPLPAGTTHATLERPMPPRTVFHWRVRAAEGRDPLSSGIGRFESPSCAVGDLGA